jgi:SAM-dependent methyltransferase
MENYYKIYNKNNLSENRYNYLDIGFKKDYKINLFKKIFLINKNNVYGAYINLPSKPNVNSFDYKKIENNGFIDYPNNFFNIITCWDFFEKIPNITLILNELKRILKTNGLLVISINESYNLIDNELYNINDILYYFSNNKFNKKKWNEYLKNNSFNRYSNFVIWNTLLKEYGFDTFGFTSCKNNLFYTPYTYNKSYIIYIKK